MQMSDQVLYDRHGGVYARVVVDDFIERIMADHGGS